MREGPRRLGGASETRARGSRPRPLGRVLGGRETRAGGVRIRGLLRAACGEDGCEPKAAEGAAEPCAPGRSRPRGAICGAGIGPGAQSAQRLFLALNNLRGKCESMRFRVLGLVTVEPAVSYTASAFPFRF